MQIRAAATPLLNWTGDALAIGLTEESLELTEELAQFDQKLAGILSELLQEDEFEGKANTIAVTRVAGQSPIRKLIVIGVI